MPAPAESPTQRTLIIAKENDVDEDNPSVKMSDAKVETVGNDVEDSVNKEDSQEKTPVTKGKRGGTKRLSTLEKTAQEGAAIIKGLDTSVGDMEGRRRTRSSARGLVSTPVAPTPPKREKKETPRGTGRGRGRGRPKKNDLDGDLNNKGEKDENSKMDVDNNTNDDEKEKDNGKNDEEEDKDNGEVEKPEINNKVDKTPEKVDSADEKNHLKLKRAKKRNQKLRKRVKTRRKMLLQNLHQNQKMMQLKLRPKKRKSNLDMEHNISEEKECSWVLESAPSSVITNWHHLSYQSISTSYCL